MYKKLFLFALFFVGVGLISTAMSNKVLAATCTWNGNFNGNWNDTANWETSGGCTGAAATGDDLIFPATATTYDVYNVISDLHLNSITFNGAYHLTGSSIIVDNGIFSTNSSLVVDVEITITTNSQYIETGTYNGVFNLVPTHDILARTTSGSIILNGLVTGAGWIITSGSGTVEINGANNFAGVLEVSDGSNVYLGNNSAVGTGTNAISFDNGGGNIVIKDGITIANDVSVFSDGTISADTAAQATLSGDINLSNQNIIFGAGSGGTLTFSGAISGTGNISYSSAGTVKYTGSGNTFTGDSTLTTGTLSVDGTYGNLGMTDGALKGAGTIGTLIAYSGSISPGNSPGILNTGDLFLTASDTLNFELNGTTVGTQYDRIAVTGDVNLANATLNLSLGYVPTLGDNLTIMTATGTINGTFAGLNPGAHINLGGYNFDIGYSSNTVFLVRSDDLLLLSFTATPTSVTLGSPVTLTAHWGSTGPVLDGTVSFYDGGTLLADNVPMVSGVATFTTSALTLGSHTITTAYSGDDTFSGAISGPITVNVLQALSNTGTQVPVLLGLVEVVICAVAFIAIYKKYKTNAE